MYTVLKSVSCLKKVIFAYFWEFRCRICLCQPDY